MLASNDSRVNAPWRSTSAISEIRSSRGALARAWISGVQLARRGRSPAFDRAVTNVHLAGDQIAQVRGVGLPE
jgi:hypothetical protein